MADFDILQGTDGGIAWPIVIKDENNTEFDLTGYTVKAQIRSTTGNLLHEFSSLIGNASVVGNLVTLRWTHAQTSMWRWDEGKYDLEITSPTNSVIQVDKGFVNLIKEVTQ